MFHYIACQARHHWPPGPDQSCRLGWDSTTDCKGFTMTLSVTESLYFSSLQSSPYNINCMTNPLSWLTPISVWFFIENLQTVKLKILWLWYFSTFLTDHGALFYWKLTFRFLIKLSFFKLIWKIYEFLYLFLKPAPELKVQHKFNLD